jgi:nucleoside-diphosphate-sugar epimerase
MVDRLSGREGPLTSKVLVTGLSGLIGRHLAVELDRRGYEVTGSVRDPRSLSDIALPESVASVSLGSIGTETEWAPCLQGVSHVFHTAAHVHVRHPSAHDRLLFRQVNVHATESLANSCVEAGVGRLVFLSSAAVCSDPLTDYGQSKLDAERAILRVCEGSSTTPVIVRPPMVYGPSARGNFARLDRLVRTRLPLPIRLLKARRSLISVFNLVDFLIHVITVARLDRSVWPIADGPAVETAELFRQIARARSIDLREWPLSPALIDRILRLAGRGDDADRLLSSFELDITETLASIGWKPPYTLLESLRRCVASGERY